VRLMEEREWVYDLPGDALDSHVFEDAGVTQATAATGTASSPKKTMDSKMVAMSQSPLPKKTIAIKKAPLMASGKENAAPSGSSGGGGIRRAKVGEKVLLKGKPVFDYNFLTLQHFRWEGEQTLSAGKHMIGFDFTYDGPGVAKGGSGVLKVDGQVVATNKIPHTVAFLWPRDETFDVGIDTRTSVQQKDYQVPFAFSGKLNKLTFKLGPEQMVAEDLEKAKAAALKRD